MILHLMFAVGQEALPVSAATIDALRSQGTSERWHRFLVASLASALRLQWIALLPVMDDGGNTSETRAAPP